MSAVLQLRTRFWTYSSSINVPTTVRCYIPGTSLKRCLANRKELTMGTLYIRIMLTLSFEAVQVEAVEKLKNFEPWSGKLMNREYLTF